MNILAIETSTEACAIGLSTKGRHYTRFELTPRRHTECVLPWSDELLSQAALAKTDLQAIAVGIGPGAFTGVRLGLSLAQGMALALGVPLLPLPTLGIIAQAQTHEGPIAVLMDARMGECYVGFYQKQNGVAHELISPALLKPDAIKLPFEGEWIGVGSAFSAYPEQLPQALRNAMRCIDAEALPQPEAMLQMAEQAFTKGAALPPEHVEPIYLRNNVAQTIAERTGHPPVVGDNRIS
jgi:tRNA threonylcarbamoyladenosine biosynthesis protein TsaB